MSERNWTDNQLQCLQARGGTVLVSAAAGSGKTAVLIERIIRRITDETSPINIDDLLVVTFTNAAAAEMKQRLSVKLAEMAAQDPHNSRLIRQQIRLQNAHISTVHGFCSSLIKENFHLLGISPQSKLADDTQQKVMRQEAVEQTLDTFYSDREDAFEKLAGLLDNGKGDDGLVGTVLRIYEFIQSHPFPEDWLAQHLKDYQEAADVQNTLWGQTALDSVRLNLLNARNMIQQALRQMDGDEQMEKAYVPGYSSDLEQINRLLEITSAGNWDELYAAACAVSFEKLGSLRKYEDTAKKDLVKALRKNAQDLVKEICSLLFGPQEKCLKDIRDTAPLVETLFKLVKAFGQEYVKIKQQRNMLDFNDLEHGALKLLVERREDGSYAKTALAQEYTNQFAEIMVDEYQDTNAAQDTLFAALSKDGTNLFMVGDVKQSIYGFRQAMPELFLKKKDAFAAYDGEHFPATISLYHNFRSRVQVTDAVNFIFRQIMTRDTCGIDYAEHEELIPHPDDYVDQPACNTSLTILTGTMRDETDSCDRQQATEISSQIAQLMKTMTVKDSGVQRPLRYGDICILLRVMKNHGNAFVTTLTEHGIPAWTSSSGGLFETPEVSGMLALLRLIDNPLLDIPLLSVLLSPFFGFSEDDISVIRFTKKKVPLYVAFTRYAVTQTDELAARCRAFLKKMEAYRTLAASLPVDRLMSFVMDDLHILLAAEANSCGAQRAANLHLFYEMARSFEKDGFRGLSAFVSYLDRVEKQNADFAPASVQSDFENVVRVMSIHNSKGLEFPVVFLADLNTAFNQKSTEGKVLLHSKLGVGLKRRNRELLVDSDTLPRKAVAVSIRNSERAEELRVLYVAMTRAREKLCLVMSAKNLPTALATAACGLDDTTVIPAHQVLSASSMGQWILAAALRLPCAGLLRKLAGREDLALLPADQNWDIRIHDLPADEENGTDAVRDSSPAAPDAAVADGIIKRITAVYPYEPLTLVSSKYAASHLKDTESLKPTHVAVSRPRFASAKGLTPSERGIALHTFMQFADFSAASRNPEEEINRLVSQAFLTEQQGQCLNRRQISSFFSCPLYQRMAASQNCLREWHFALDLPAAQFHPDIPADSPEKVIIQGIADALFEEKDGFVIVDYKTDHVKQEQELVERYSDQLKMYVQAVEAILNKPVSGVYLYSFALGHEIELPPDTLRA